MKFNVMTVFLAGIIGLANHQEIITTTHFSNNVEKKTNQAVESECNSIKCRSKIYFDEYMMTESRFGMN